MSYKELENW